MAKRNGRPTTAPSDTEIRQIPTDDLLLDNKNPRLRGAAEGADQGTLLEILLREGALDELALSIANNGYFPEEPLFAVKENEKYTVIEGNRRLATVKILLDTKLQQTLRVTDFPQLNARERDGLTSLPVSVHPDRESLWAYIGFRHVNGPMTWDSWSKAQYIAQVHNTFGIGLDQIAERIGDKNQTVRRLYRGLMVLNQATEQADYKIEGRTKSRLSFSHLYTGLDYGGFQQHLGLEKTESYKQNPIAQKNLSNLKELMVWLYGSQEEDQAPVIKTQNPDLKRLDDVLKHPRALSALRSGLGLDVSHNLSRGESARLREVLTRAKYDLQQAKGLILEGYKGEMDLRETVASIADLAESLLDDMSGFDNKRSRRTRGHQ